jgi:hypothetical protein
MSKSPWIILVMGVIACAVLAVMSQVYLRKSPAMQIRDGLENELHLKDVIVSVSPEKDGYTISYSPDAALAGNPKALERNMRDVAEFVQSRFPVTRVRVNAKTPDGEIHKFLYPPEPAPQPVTPPN